MAQTEAGVGEPAEISVEEAKRWTSRTPMFTPEPDVKPEPGSDPWIGRVLSGLYRIKAQIGEGGMGSVYTALHIHLNKAFAIKVLSDRIAGSQEAVERLLQEARTASSIDHDNIVDVVSFDVTEEGRVFLVMELLKGTSLGDLVERGPMTLVRALPIFVQLCDAITAAHQRNIVHRDLKPDNVFIVRKRDADFVKVLDFGISKVQSNDADQVRMTQTGQLMGTPLYMSPEQAKGEMTVDHRADIYSMGIMLYEMLTGCPPFEGSNYFQLLWKHGNEQAREPHLVLASVPEAVSDVIMKALEKAPDARYQSTAEFRDALLLAAPAVNSGPPRLVSMTPPEVLLPASRTADAPPQKKVPWAVWAIGALFLVTLGVGASSMNTMINGPPEQTPVLTPGVETETEPAETEPAETEPAETEPLDIEPIATTVTVSFSSSPSGATVYPADSDEPLGVTPFTLALPEGVAHRVQFRLRRHLHAQQEFVAEEQTTVQADLVRRPSRMNSSSQAMDIPEARTEL